ncbi:MAG: hypothetical protein BMS9Abin29_1913 [Gemmatimonadota bacterium]|nr:MAG: hypothetical protein BMS9Abin29_1913 [Gemmatimonadota bacterium]
MKAIILAAGQGSRLGAKAKGLPKALQRVGNQTLIEHQLEALSAEGVGPVVVVIGHGADHIKTVLGDSVDYVLNEKAEETNSLYSLWLARDWLREDVLLLNCDVLFHPDILKRLLRASGSALAYDSTSASGAEQTKVGMRGPNVSDLGKDFPDTGARGENVGIIKLDAEGSLALRSKTEAIIRSGGENSWVTEAVRAILAEVGVEGVNVAGLPWVEIDFPYDLDRARRQVWPQIQKSLHPWQQLLRRVRVPAALVAAGGVIMAVWTLSAQVGPASVDWESLAPATEGVRVAIQRVNKGPQSWWKVPAAGSLTIEVTGSAPTRVESRALFLADTELEDVPYVLEMTLDGRPYRFEANRSSPDDNVSLEGYRVGTRDRDRFVVPEGHHTLVVRLLAGEIAGVLVRVRQPG